MFGNRCKYAEEKRIFLYDCSSSRYMSYGSRTSSIDSVCQTNAGSTSNIQHYSDNKEREIVENKRRKIDRGNEHEDSYQRFTTTDNRTKAMFQSCNACYTDVYTTVVCLLKTNVWNN